LFRGIKKEERGTPDAVLCREMEKDSNQNEYDVKKEINSTSRRIRLPLLGGRRNRRRRINLGVKGEKSKRRVSQRRVKTSRWGL